MNSVLHNTEPGVSRRTYSH